MANRPPARRYARLVLLIVAVVLAACAAAILAYRVGFPIGAS